MRRVLFRHGYSWLGQDRAGNRAAQPNHDFERLTAI
jgi:hypothetical protein